MPPNADMWAAIVVVTTSWSSFPRSYWLSYVALVDQTEINNWARIAVDCEAAGETDSVFYERARAIALGEQDPLAGLSVIKSADFSQAA